MTRLLALAFLFSLAVAHDGAAQQNFSCPWGKDAACLDYGDKVCSSMGKCVDQSAACFQQNTCDFNGFMCVSDHEEYVKKAKAMASDYDDFKSCVVRAEDMDAVQTCIRLDYH